MTAHTMNQTRPQRINEKANVKAEQHDGIPTSPTNASTTSGGSSNSSSGASRKRGRELAGKHDAKDFGEKAIRTSHTISPASSVAAMAHALAASHDHADHESEDAELSEEETSDVDQLASVAVAAAASGRATTATGAPRERRLKSLSQLVVLKNFYAIHPRVTKDQVRKLIAQTGLTHREVTRWFRNERHKEKKLKEQGASLNYSSGVVNAAQAALLIENERKARNNQHAAQQQQSQQTSPQQQPQMHPSAAAVHQLPPQAQMMSVQPTYYRMQPTNGAYPPPGYAMTYPAPYAMPVMSALAPPMHFAPAAAVAVPNAQPNTGSPSSSPSTRFPPATNPVQQAAQQAVAQAQLQYESAMRTTTTMLMSGAATPQQLMPYYNPSYGTPSYLTPSYLPPLHSTSGQTSSTLAPATQFKPMTGFPYMQTIGDASASANGNANANSLVSAETQAALAVTSMSAKPISV